MTTINETVEQSMNAAGLGGYRNNVAPVVTALINREQQIVGNLLTFAQNSDLDVAAVRNSLADAGLHMPVEAPAAPEAAATVGQQVDAGVAAALARIEQALTGLTTFARRNGYNG